LQAPNALALTTFALVQLFLAIFERLFQKPRITYRNNNRQSQLIMKKQTLRIYAIAAGAGLLIAAGGSAYPQQTGVSEIRDESADQMVQLGGAIAYSVDAVDRSSYQWLRNGAAISGQTNSTLILENAQVSDAGYYSCDIANGAEMASTITASLMVYTITPDFLVVVYATPIVSGGGSGTCPGPYAGYVNYTKTAAQGWGWQPNTNTTIHTASDTTRSDTKIQYVGKKGDVGCNQTIVTVPDPTFSTAYRFTICFTNNVPSTNYPMTLNGFNP
jgi:hypothetical protein